MVESRIRPIRSEQDYETALARIEALMEIERSQAEDDEFDVLTTLVELYEDRHFPMDVPDPLEAIRFRMEQLGKTQSDLAPIFGSRAKASEVLSGKRPLTLKMIRAMHEHLGIPAEVLIRGGDALPDRPAGIEPDRFPLREMANRRWITAASNLKDRAEEIILDLVERAGGRNALPQALFRQGGARANAKTDAHALQAWCLYVLVHARSLGLEGRYCMGSITPKFLRGIAKLSVFDEGPRLAQEKLAQSGIALIIARHLPKTYLDGAALITREGVPVVGMTLRYDRLDNFWFCLLHELAHLGWHFRDGEGQMFIDDLQLRERDHAADDQQEQEADELAQEALIPDRLWSKHPALMRPTVANVLTLAREAEVHPAIVAGRIRYERHSYRLLSQFVGANLVRPQFHEEAA
jgi:HTH-type transcriptional regulator/antitoxin HigA